MICVAAHSPPPPATQTARFLPDISPLLCDSSITSPGNPDGNIIPYLTDCQENSVMTAYSKESFRVPSNPELMLPAE
eukprot:420853-Ditylum_brightwellii.AAC.1